MRERKEDPGADMGYGAGGCEFGSGLVGGLAEVMGNEGNGISE